MTISRPCREMAPGVARLRKILLTAAIFWLKTRARWREMPGEEAPSVEGVKVEFVTVYDGDAPRKPMLPDK